MRRWSAGTAPRSRAPRTVAPAKKSKPLRGDAGPESTYSRARSHMCRRAPYLERERNNGGAGSSRTCADACARPEGEECGPAVPGPGQMSPAGAARAHLRRHLRAPIAAPRRDLPTGGQVPRPVCPTPDGFYGSDRPPGATPFADSSRAASSVRPLLSRLSARAAR